MRLCDNVVLLLPADDVVLLLVQPRDVTKLRAHAAIRTCSSRLTAWMTLGGWRTWFEVAEGGKVGGRGRGKWRREKKMKKRGKGKMKMGKGRLILRLNFWES